MIHDSSVQNLSPVLYFTVLYCTILYHTVRYYAVPLPLNSRLWNFPSCLLAPQWLEVVSKRVRSTIVGEVPAGNWAAEVDDYGDGDNDAMAVDGIEDVDQAPGKTSEGDGHRHPSSPGSDGAGDHIGAPTTIKAGEEVPGTDTCTPSADVEKSNRGGAAAATARVHGGRKTEAELRERLLAAMGRSKKSDSRCS